MAFKFVRSAGAVQDPAVIEMMASGTIFANSVVVRDDATNVVSTAAAANMTSTNIVGISLDYVQGASDTYVKVIPFAKGQVWEADTVNAVSTAQVLLRHTLANSLLVRNIGNTYETGSVGIFLALAITGATSGSGKILGTFLTQDAPQKSGLVQAL